MLVLGGLDVSEPKIETVAAVDHTVLIYNWAQNNRDVCWVPGSEQDRIIRRYTPFLQKVDKAIGRADPGSIALSQLPSLPSIVLDMKTISRLLSDFGMTGTFKTVTRRGRSYVIFKGYAGTRTIFRGTRYLASNPKVVNMAVGRTGTKAMVAGSMKVNFICFVPFFIINELFFDEKEDTLAALGVRFASGVSKMAIASAVALLVTGGAAGIVVAGAGAAFLVGVGVAVALEAVDNYFGITKAMEEYATELQRKFEQKATETYVDFEKQFIQWIESQTNMCIPVYKTCW